MSKKLNTVEKMCEDFVLSNFTFKLKVVLLIQRFILAMLYS